jgi:hypothetical protein
MASEIPKTDARADQLQIPADGPSFGEHELSSTVWSAARIAGSFGAQRR